jgi:hypothetical protein
MHLIKRWGILSTGGEEIIRRRVDAAELWRSPSHFIPGFVRKIIAEKF